MLLTAHYCLPPLLTQELLKQLKDAEMEIEALKQYITDLK